MGERGAPSIGVLGGTFDPPHAGHLALARQALAELQLDEVLLMPAHTPPHKEPEPHRASPRTRLAMCELAAAEVDGVRASALEVQRGGPSYTVDTLERLHEDSPDALLTLIVGADMALTLPAWRRPRRIVQLARLAVAQRDGAGEEQVLRAIEPLGCGPEGVSLLRMAPVAVSSSAVRERVAAGESIDGLVPAAVAAYVAEHGLYAEAQRAPSERRSDERG